MAITNYALIDHVGSVEDMKKIYNLAYELAAEAGFYKKDKSVWTMKATCLTFPNAQKTMATPESYKKLKNVVRFNKHPKHVYLICDTIENSDVKTALWIWEQNFTPVTVISEYDGVIEDTREYDFDLEISMYRRCALIWSRALGWEFSAPLIHNNQLNTPDSWLKRPEYQEIVEIQNGDIITRADVLGNHISKISTNPDKFVDTFHTIAPEKECKAFFEQYLFYKGFDRQADGSIKFNEERGDQIAYFLEPDWTLCPTCGKPVRLGTAESIICDYCDTKLHSEVFETYYDDSYKEDSDEWD